MKDTWLKYIEYCISYYKVMENPKEVNFYTELKANYESRIHKLM